jgi:hypothetical protein
MGYRSSSVETNAWNKGDARKDRKDDFSDKILHL